MMTRRTAVLGSLALAIVGFPAWAAPKRSRAMLLVDSNNDGALQLDEARRAASALFDRMDHNHNGTLNRRELGGRVIPQEFAAADRNRDGRLSKQEFLSVMERRFKAAEPDPDGRLDDRKLSTRAGRALLRLLN